MQLRWTEEAASDLERIGDYLFLHAASRASELGGRSLVCGTQAVESCVRPRQQSRSLVFEGY